MNRSVSVKQELTRLPMSSLGAALALMLAIGAGMLLAQLLMQPPARDMRTMAAYLTLTGAATMAGGWLALRAADRAVGLSIQSKAFLSAVISNGVAFLNLVIVAQLMFVSTAHDLKLLLALIGFSAVVTAFFSLWVASTIAGRTQAVAKGIQSLAAGSFDTQLPVDGGDEVAQLARDVNVLAARLYDAEQQRRALDAERIELTAAISHDLRTPLASVRAMVEALADEVVSDPQEVHRYYGMLRREVERLDAMIADLFELAQMDAGALSLNRGPVALQEIAAEVVDAMQAQAQCHGVKLSLDIDGDPPQLVVDGARMERAVANLVRNALEHTPQGGRVDVHVKAEDGSVAMRVTDTGEGIDPRDLARIWDRFFRAEKSRHRRNGDQGDGAGLGLTIVRGVIEAHGGTVDVNSLPGKGSTFTVHIPRTPVSRTQGP